MEVEEGEEEGEGRHLEGAAVSVELAADLGFGTVVLVAGELQQRGTRQSCLTCMCGRRADRNRYLTPGQRGGGAVVRTGHRKRWTHRLFVFLKELHKTKL